MARNALSCLDLRRRYHIKHRSLKIWTGWSLSFSIFALMAWTYWTYISSADTGAGRVFGKGFYSADRLLSGPTQDDPTGSEVVQLAYSLLEKGRYNDSCKLFRKRLQMDCSLAEECDASLYGLVKAYIALNDLKSARIWTDKFYETSTQLPRMEPAYYLCKALRETGQNLLASYYYLLAKSFAIQPSAAESVNKYIPVDDALYDYLLDYENSILWSYVGDFKDGYSRLHGMALSVKLLEKRGLPSYIRESIFNNQQYYVMPLSGEITILHQEKSTEEEWRYSTPTFLGEDTLIRVVNYYVAEDGSYHVSKGDKVNTRLMLEKNVAFIDVKLSESFQIHASADSLVHHDSYILGLEDTRVVLDRSNNNTVFTISASEEYSKDSHTMNQVLGTLDLDNRLLRIQNVIQGPQGNRHDKNWVFAGGIQQVVYDWYPFIEIGSINLQDSALEIHTKIPSPQSFHEMRGSTNGVLYEKQWWFVTHAVIYRAGQMRKYLHRLVVLDEKLSSLVRFSLPFTFEEPSDVEYCLGLKVDESGLTFGYSVRDRSSRILRVPWGNIGRFFDGDSSGLWGTLT